MHTIIYVGFRHFRGPKSKNRHGGTVSDDTDMSGRRSETMKEGREVTRVCRAMWHGCATLARGDHAALPVRVWASWRLGFAFGVQSSWRLGFSSRKKTLNF